MCGICGIVANDPQQVVDQAVIERMKASIAHRGPDDEGIHIEPGVGLGFRRLSIVDLEHGHQPMSNEDGSYWIVFNGEIYNHGDLRPFLKGRSHQFKTRCDTETIVHLFEEEGTRGFSRMNGMFALCIWDRRTARAVLCRDRLGIKPLYYRITEEGLSFASEIKALLQDGTGTASIDPEGIEEYLTFRFVAGDRTLFKGIYALSPGQVLIYEQGRVTREWFWKMPEPGEVLRKDKQVSLNELDGYLEESVTLRLMSDVPVGTFCSGGIDSGLTTAYATEGGMNGIDTFSVGFSERDFDETRFAELVSKRYSTRHHPLVITNESFAEFLPKAVWYNDEPLNHANSVPIHLIARLARQFVTVVLTGEGADELFAGYPRYNIAKIWMGASLLPVELRKLWRSLTSLAGGRRLRKLGYYMPFSAVEAALRNAAFLQSEVVRGLLSDGVPASDFPFRRSLLDSPTLARKDLLDRLWRLDLRTYLVSLLNRMDKMTMAASIEARVPFLDHRLVEWALRVSPALKLHGFTNKYLVRRLGLTKLPREVVERGKSGFGLPIGLWLKEERLLGRYLDLFFDDAFGRRDYLNIPRVRSLVREHLSGTADHAEAIWNLINLELWHRMFLEGDLSWLDQESAGGSAIDS